MASEHHGSRKSQSEFIQRFREQLTGEYKREFPDGRMGADDDGELTYAVATDHKHRTIVIRFAHKTDWIGFDIESAEKLRDALTERLHELRGITT